MARRRNLPTPRRRRRAAAGLTATLLLAAGPLAAEAPAAAPKAERARTAQKDQARQQAPSRQPAAVRLAACDPVEASATFVAEMRARRGAASMSLRFRLQAREPGQRWTDVAAPGFGPWLDARRGNARFIYSKTLTELKPGQYRVRVHFRWRDAAGKTVARSSRRSPVCSQRDERPDLRPLALTATATGWVLTVANHGEGTSSPALAQLVAGGAPQRLRIPPLDPGEQTKIHFGSHGCEPGSTVSATVDPDDDLDEADETGKTITATCPAPPTVEGR